MPGLINASELVLDVKNADRVTTTAPLRERPGHGAARHLRVGTDIGR
jgi:hypothetical protein